MQEIQDNLKSNAIMEHVRPEVEQFVLFMQSKTETFEDYIKCFNQALFRAFFKLNPIEQEFNKNQMKTLYQLIIFSSLDKFIDSKKYLVFDFNRFYEDEINNLKDESLQNNVMTFIIQCKMKI